MIPYIGPEIIEVLLRERSSANAPPKVKISALPSEMDSRSEVAPFKESRIYTLYFVVSLLTARMLRSFWTEDVEIN
ncbi:hypothetical protein [Granulicella sp. dw_53]|uniref:hypothetical protein n=1 Tax=Granulicella sp. dw_53 TaxID=2719792 RepID=UPI001BD38CEE|nr:hypothetical protein [Granulicella sp. dw_53]